MSFGKNLLLEWLDDSKCNRIERILWLNLGNNDVVTIELNNTTALPMWQKCSEIEIALAANAVQILEVDPYVVWVQKEEEIDEKHKQHRDEAWQVIEPLIEKGEQIFIRTIRGRLVADTVVKTGRTSATIYNYLRRYWQGGQVKNALLPRFDQCGGSGKLRQNNHRKRGRPNKLTLGEQQAIGVNVDQQVREYFRRGIQLFYETRSGRTLKQSYQLTLEKFFHQGYETINGVLVPILPPAEELPTYAQFYYWYKKDRDLCRTLKSRVGEHRFNLRHRAVTGNATNIASGPGSLYQIDATIGDIYLVSSLDRNRLIGRPVIYLVVDVFSRLIVGFSVSLEGPSWLGAMLALENATANKVKFCQEYGIEITEAQWPSHHLPEAILADRGELLSNNANNLVNALGIRVDNTPPFRPDWKPIVERYFRLSNDKLIHWMPGAVHQTYERGDKDYRLDAVLDLNQFRKLMLLCILDHNNQHRLDTYPANEYMIADGVEPYPINLWHWGVQNQGCPRVMPREIVRLNLLPTDSASVTHQGIYYRGLFYTCELAVREQWFIKARLEGRWKLSIAYDPRQIDTIYLRNEGGKRMEVCHLLPVSKTFTGRDWHEATDYLALKQQRQQVAQTRSQRSQAVFHATVEEIVCEASTQTEAARCDLNPHKRVKNIRSSRQLERDHERLSGADYFRPEVSDNAQRVVPIVRDSQLEGEEQEYVPPPQPFDKLRRLREESWNNDS
ncbi:MULTISPECIES: Mu transposase C-terminal domain-containing protein [unclassified Tolypothrix]|uniref:Mu transposase C-terminal domain-containing protein n=1 Tax=unclassified Tolypothrix TaxID=2649714 RepID=UPI0005EAAC4F|nr:MULTISPECIES: Mu transposase C-terminal domain-containing protein [unclassified Tolypothrix]BAY95297.1 HMG-I and HMG-Y, DNA-binding protein [Microchaete diplosiphon NIES-3275]EKE98288.1 putative integrase [Tolypothrix sp. PCC 7601]MBE9084017.1 DDE-type integrase/transposase/recombinase [Tolypothrix sp. LEGE 11397]UYD30521.1 DDE-type integrase/transposase/recombinase [Tolypothrix sp. PCC 7712]UYD38346.1 transposase [Tolypothrix sp. PCC 7601]